MPRDPHCSESELVIRTLYEIAGEYDRGLPHQVRRILRLGLARFDLDIGILSHIREGRYTVIHQVSPPGAALRDGAEFPLGDTYCCMTMAADGPFGLEHVAQSEFCSHPAYRSFCLESYVGVPVRVRDTVYGTLNFSSPDPRPRAFSSADMDALRLMASWVGSELSRRQTEQALIIANKRLEAQAREDPLTHLLNRRGFEQKLGRLVERCARSEDDLIGLAIDVDDFKTINTDFGYATGDRALVAIAEAIANAVRPTDICGRVGGDEFMVLLPNCSLRDAQNIAQRLRTAVNAIRIASQTGQVRLSVSIGVVPLVADVRGVTGALAASEDALRAAKASGKNTISVQPVTANG